MSRLLWIVLQWTLGWMYLLELWFSLDICPGVGLLDHTVALFLVFKGTSILFSTEAAPIYIPTNSARGFSFSTPSPAFVICGIFNDGHSDSCQMVLRWDSFKKYFSLRMIALQNFLVFCQTSTWINHSFMHISPPFWTSLLSPSPFHPSSLIQSPCLSFLSHTANSYWLFILQMVM